MKDENENKNENVTVSVDRATLPATLVMSDEVRVKLHEKYKQVEERLSKLKKVSNTPAKTNGQFKYAPDGNRVASMIHEEKKVATLLEIYGFLMQKNEYYDQAAEEVGLDKVGYPPFTWLGFPAKDWLADIEVRLSIISYREEYDRLTKIKAQLSEFFLPEDKLLQLFETLKDF
jgi:hypothetical protein